MIRPLAYKYLPQSTTRSRYILIKQEFLDFCLMYPVRLHLDVHYINLLFVNYVPRSHLISSLT